MSGFIGRERELALLTKHLDWVRAGGADQRGRALLLRGRRRVGKSRLVDVFCRESGVPQILAAEFPTALQPRQVLTAVGSGERTFTGIANRLGSAGTPSNPGSLSPALRGLLDKRIIAVDTPLSEKPGDKDRRYRVADPYLRFWLAFLETGIAEVESGRGDRLIESVERSWLSWRGRAVEPVIREALMRILPDERWPEVREVGGWWPRTNNPEVDLVGADRVPARRISFVGSIKWLERSPFDGRDLAALARDAVAVPGSEDDTPLVAVSRSGFAVDGLAGALGPDELITAWRPR